MELQIRDSEDNQQHYYWRAVNDGEVLAWSETMFNKSDCVNAAQTVKHGSVKGYFWHQASNGYYYWTVQGLNGRTLLASPANFRSSDAASAVANYVSANARYASIVDYTKVGSR